MIVLEWLYRSRFFFFSLLGKFFEVQYIHSHWVLFTFFLLGSIVLFQLCCRKQILNRCVLDLMCVSILLAVFVFTASLRSVLLVGGGGFLMCYMLNPGAGESGLGNVPGISDGDSNDPTPDPFGDGGNAIAGVDLPEEEEEAGGNQQPVGAPDDLGDSTWGRQQLKAAQEQLHEEQRLSRNQPSAERLQTLGLVNPRARIKQLEIIILVLQRMQQQAGFVMDAEAVVQGVKSYTDEFVYCSSDVQSLSKLYKDFFEKGLSSDFFEEMTDIRRF